MADKIRNFIESIATSLRDDSFVKLTLSNYKGAEAGLQRILVRQINTKKGSRLDLTYRYKDRDVAKNYSLDDGMSRLSELIGDGFRNANLFTTAGDIQIEVRKSGEPSLSRSRPRFSEKLTSAHDRAKKLVVDPHTRYLRELGITSENGEVLGKQRDKWTQINKYVEIVIGLIDSSSLKDKRSVTVVDMGSGKGYLTFALYEYLTNSRGLEARVTGVETRQELVDFCRGVAGRCEFSRLKFVRDNIETFPMPAADITIALHACDTATDDAIFKGVSARSEIIITAPCCHKEIRRQIKSPAILADVLRHGTLMETTAETITDGLRALLLEGEGYSSKVFEFVSAEHTPKNNMIVGVRRRSEPKRLDAKHKAAEIKSFFGIRSQRLESLLEKSISD